jgi:hypothetical protein
MSYVVAVPEAVVAAVNDLSRIGSTIEGANAVAAVSTTGELAAAAEEVSVAVGALFSGRLRPFRRSARRRQSFIRSLCRS